MILSMIPKALAPAKKAGSLMSKPTDSNGEFRSERDSKKFLMWSLW